jgi:hypothetical protein
LQKNNFNAVPGTLLLCGIKMALPKLLRIHGFVHLNLQQAAMALPTSKERIESPEPLRYPNGRLRL